MKVICTNGVKSVMLDLIPAFERTSGTKIVITWGSTNGLLKDLEGGAGGDLAILTAEAIDDLTGHGKVVAGSRVDLARSGIGAAVRGGSPKPDISTVDALRRTLLAAKSIAYPSSISGLYLTTELFPRLGIAEQVAAKSRRIDASERVGAVVARGEAEIGFQQISELLSVPGVTYVGPLPADVQRVTVFAAGVSANAPNATAARAAIAFLVSPAARAAIAKSGLDPVAQNRDPFDLANAPVRLGTHRIACGSNPLQVGELCLPSRKGL